MKKFYNHLLEIETLTVELDKLDLSENERLHLARLIDSNLHHSILDVILSELSDHDKQKFIKLMEEGDHQKIWDHLNSRVDKIEEKIKGAINEAKVQLHEDIKEAVKQE